MLNEIFDIYYELKTYNKDLSLRRFSKDYLGASENYLTTTRYYNRDVSHKQVRNLRNNLREMANAWGSLYAESKSQRYAERHNKLLELSNKTNEMLTQ